MIKIVNPNKHVQNGEDGGRKRKLRHVSKIDCFKRGSDAIKPFCKDLFGSKSLFPEASSSSQLEDESISTNHDQNFSQILEERNEESPNGKTDQSMKSNSRASNTEFKL